MLKAQANGVCTIGICGMGGIGKTTTAKAVYDKLFNEFDGGSFIEDIREASSSIKGLRLIQEKLIYNILGKESVTVDTVERGRYIIKRRLGGKRVLIVLDNIDRLDQLKALLGDQTCDWAEDLFGGGSKIIIATRDEGVLHSYGIYEHQIYRPQELEYPWSLKLFHKHAFIHKPPSLPLLRLAEEAAGIAGGLPLVLELFGSVFAGLRTIEHWEGELKKLRKSQPKDIFEKLRWSYDGLDDEQKSVFLDIAFFSVGAKRKYAAYLWDEYALQNALRVLQERSLICIDDEERFRMHDQIQEMGRQVARHEGNRDHCMNKRLRATDETLISSMERQEKRRVEGIVLDMEEECIDSNLSTEVFMDMSKLRLLHLNFVDLQELEINHFPKSLKWLRWRGCVLESVTFDGRSFRNLAILDLSRSNISQLILRNKLDRLKMLDLSHCNRMEATPNFACTPNLEKLFLDDCIVLSEIHGSICGLGNLTTLSMRNCQVVKELPEDNQYFIANLFKLVELNLQGCKQLQSLPRLPSSLNKLILQGCKELKAIHRFENLKYIEILDMDGCEGIDCTIMNKLFQGKSFTHIEELRISGGKTMHEGKRFLFVIPFCSSSSPLLLEHLECYGHPHNLDNVYIKVCVKDTEDNQVIYETILNAPNLDIPNERDDRSSYSISFSEYDDINFQSSLSEPCSIWVSTTRSDFCLERVDIVLRSVRKWSQNDSERIPIDESLANINEVSKSICEHSTVAFDVFFSYTEEDIDANFIENLSKAIEDRGICIFKGEDGESKGRKVEELFEHIERSLICIPIFSFCFLQSKWCLNSVAKMVECRKLIIPVYFRVHPLEIETYFSNHTNEYPKHLVEDWRKAWKVSRRHQQFIYETNKYMEEYTIAIRDQISAMLNSIAFRLPPIVFGSCANNVVRMLEKERKGVCMIGICGQDGIGKTTIAKAIHHQLSHKFHDSTFIADVGVLARTNQGLASLQQKLRLKLGKQKMVLMVFDDVDELNESESHMIFTPYKYNHKRRPIIIIAKDKRKLVSYGLKKDDIFCVSKLDSRQSLRLLGYHAFKGKQPTLEFIQLAKKAIKFAGGLPLSLAILGSLFSCKSTKNEWESILERLESAHVGEGIDEILKISIDDMEPPEQRVFFDIACVKENATSEWEDHGCYPGNTIRSLEERCLVSLDAENRLRMNDAVRDWGQRWIVQVGNKLWRPMIMDGLDDLDLHHCNVFLDIACCLIGCEKEYATYIWEDCGYSPVDKIKALQDRSLVKIDEEGMFRMDGYVRDMGRWIVKEEGKLKPCMYSRLWNRNNLLEAMGNEKALNNDQIECIALSTMHRTDLWIEATSNLRVLHLTNYNFECKYLRPLKNLIWLRMENSQVGTWLLDRADMLEQLLVLQLLHCRILEQSYPWPMEQLGKQGWVSIRKKTQEVFKKLKVLEILDCDFGWATLDFSVMPSLMKLVVEDLHDQEMHETLESIGDLRKLECLRIRNCQGLEKLPNGTFGNLSSLQTLDLGGCERLLELPEGLGDLTALKELVLENCVLLIEIPGSIVKLNHLQALNIRGCRSLLGLPQLPCSLQTLDLGECPWLTKLPENLGDLTALTKLILEGCESLEEIPNSVAKLNNLQTFILRGCESLQSLPQCLPYSLQTVELEGCSRLSKLPETLGDWTDLIKLSLKYCPLLKEIPNSIIKLDHLKTFNLAWCDSLQSLPQCLPHSLHTIDLFRCLRLSKLPENLGDFVDLTVLNLKFCYSLEEIPDSIVKLTQLHRITIADCRSLHRLPQLPSSLVILAVYKCLNLRQVTDVSSLQNLKCLYLYGCDELKEVPGLENLKSCYIGR